MRVELGDDVTWCDIQDDVVILNVDTGVYFGLEGTGGQMWRELVEHRSLEKALEALKKRFDVEPDDLRRDLEDMVRQLAEKGLVSLVAEPNGR
jgi:Coenzyme PQQ synthesis protein D (PqqD)